MAKNFTDKIQEEDQEYLNQIDWKKEKIVQKITKKQQELTAKPGDYVYHKDLGYL